MKFINLSTEISIKEEDIRKMVYRAFPNLEVPVRERKWDLADIFQDREKLSLVRTIQLFWLMLVTTLQIR